MGIKFLCPNGHKLHVKAFLSGKKAICPKCGARVTVPGEVSPVSTTAGDGSQQDSGQPGGAGDVLGDDLTISEGGSVILSTDLGVDPAQTAVGVRTSAPSTHATSTHADAIDEAPSAVWYVRPATGGQFGPASGEIMRSWINEGRVGASSLVWRAGWPEWRSAVVTFPQLGPIMTPGIAIPGAAIIVGGGNGSATTGASLPLGQAIQSLPADTAAVRTSVPETPAALPMAAAPRRRRKGNDISVIASIVLILVSIILVIVLILVFMRQNEPDESTARSHVLPTQGAQLASRRA
jgi:hypothetical protein